VRPELEPIQRVVRAETRLAVAREQVIRAATEILLARSDEQLHAAGLPRANTSVEFANVRLETNARALVAALDDPALLEEL